jgi:DMSO/TMAO reductase YedYZ molybdopterin-dependent catalytic subunit
VRQLWPITASNPNTSENLAMSTAVSKPSPAIDASSPFTAGRARTGSGHSKRQAAEAGIVAAAAGLGAGELWAGLVGGASPVIVVGDRVVDGVPRAIKQFAIDTLGTNDKPALIIGILVITALYAAFVGISTAKKFSNGLVGVAGFGVIGAAAALSGRSPSAGDLIPILVAAVVVIVVLWLFFRHRSTWATAEGIAEAPGIDRRRFLTLSALASLGAAIFGTVGRKLQGSPEATASRNAIVLPKATRTASSVSAAGGSSGAATTVAPLAKSSLPAFGIEGAEPYITPADKFYRIDTALVIPELDAKRWQMSISGMVDKELLLTFDDLLKRPLIEHDCTLMCVSNEIGGDLVGNARWTGVRLADVLREAGVQKGADQVFVTSTDGFTAGFPVATAFDGREAMIAIAMNGKPLPFRHGFPARLVVPGIYGYVSAVKWLADIKLTTFEEDQGYWIPRGWSALAPVKVCSRIDVPKTSQNVKAGMVPIAGIAWAQHTGIKAVEVQIDEGPWQECELAAEGTIDTWKQWKYAWDAKPGRYIVRVRAIDLNGQVQVAERAPVAPDGATGYHAIGIEVS